MTRPWPLPAAPFHRRTMLYGTGVAMGLPWLESIPLSAGEGRSDGEEFPLRFAVQFMACGIHPDRWWAKGQGTRMQLSDVLQPMAPFRERLNVIEGLFNKNANGVGIHPGQTGNILSGASLQKGAELRGGISVDQLLARHIGRHTEQPSLVLGCEQPVTGYHETNFSMAYSSHISWANATSPVPMEVYPALAFDSLFNNHGSQRNRSILDRIREDAARLARSVSTADRAKLDEYLTSVREVEQRIDQQRKAHDRAAANAANRGKPYFLMQRPDNGLPEDIQEHMKLMCDLIAIAFQTDKTRIATLLLCRDISGLFYPFLDVRNAHHSASHNDRSEDWARVSQYYVSQLAYLAGRLQEMREGDGTVLDHSLLIWVNNMWSGSRHDASRVPLLTVGDLGGRIRTGRVLDYTDAGDENRRLCSLYVSVLQHMGVETTHFGDADQPLKDL